MSYNNLLQDERYHRLGHSSAIFFTLFGLDGAPSLPQTMKNMSRRFTALQLTFIVEPALTNQERFLKHMVAYATENA